MRTRAMLNGKPVTGWKIAHADIIRGDELVFEMTGADSVELEK